MSAIEEREPPRPCVRPELMFRQRGDGSGDFLIEDPLGGHFMETDRETIELARLLDGTLSAEQALDVLHARNVALDITPDVLPMVITEMSQNGLLVSDTSGAPIRTGRRKLGLISQRIALGTGDRFFSWASRRFGWLHSVTGLLVWIGLMAFAGTTLLSSWGRFTHELGGLISLDAFLYLWAAWIVSKAWHEFNHGLVTRLYGVEVREVGILLILMFPLGAYVDVSGVWRLDDRRKRFHVTAAGVLGELALGAVALILWASTPSGNLAGFLQAIVLAATISSIVFNMNPLMRFDGYYALVDAFDAKNLYQRGMAVVRNVMFRILAGVPARQRENGSVALYGWLSLAWRMLVAVSLVILASQMAFGFGLALGLGVFWVLILVPFSKFCAALWKLGGPARRTMAFRISTAAAFVFLAMYLPVPERLSAPGMIEFKDSIDVRATAPGFIARPHAVEGETIAAGTTVVTLDNHALTAEVLHLKAEQARAAMLLSSAWADGTPADVQQAEQAWENLGEELRDATTRIDGMELAVPRPGTLITSDLDARIGTWVERGDPVFEVADPSQVQIRVWLTKSEAEWATGAGADFFFQPVTFAADAVAVTLTRLEPVATVDLPPAAVTAEGGGPLAIDTTDKVHKLTEARFVATLIPAIAPDGWVAGVPGTLSAPPRWNRLSDAVAGLFDNIDLRDPNSWAIRPD